MFNGEVGVAEDKSESFFKKKKRFHLFPHGISFHSAPSGAGCVVLHFSHVVHILHFTNLLSVILQVSYKQVILYVLLSYSREFLYVNLK